MIPESRNESSSGLSSRRVVVLGGGPAGLAAAWSLTMDGHHVTILEKEAVCGGMAGTFRRGKFRYDFGPHNIHTSHVHLLEFLKKSFGDDFRAYESVTRIYFRNRTFPYPFEGMESLKTLNLIDATLCVWGFFWQRVVSLLKGNFKSDGTYRTWLVSRFGQYFFDIFFGPYTEKVWGVATHELSDIVARKRIPVQSLYALVHAAITRRPKYHPEHSRSLNAYYHRNGSGAITDFLVNEIIKNGGEIINNATICSLIRDNNKIIELKYSNMRGEIQTIQADLSEYIDFTVLSTIPVNQLVLYLGEEIPNEVRQAANELDYAALVLLYLDLDHIDPLGSHILYFSEPEFPFNRISDVGKFSRDMVPEGQTALCLEVTCSVGDAVWNMDDDEIFAMCFSPLERHGLLSRANVLDYHTRRLTHAYPRFRVGYHQRLSTIYEYMETSIDNMWMFGRQGLFTYINTDDAMWMGIQVSSNLPMRNKIGITARDLFPKAFDS
ncbi:MAG: FAD-dependent oxidoreductase [Magnetococcales bacterium]|nr:FAD-dependent oxidoreductase [Magnetococcales bacterium]